MNKKIAGPLSQTYVRAFHPDSANGRLRYYSITLSATPGNVTTVEVPGWAKIVKIYPVADDIVYALDEDPTVGASVTDATILYTSSRPGDIAVSRQWESRIIPSNVNQVRLCSASASAEAYISFSSGE